MSYDIKDYDNDAESIKERWYTDGDMYTDWKEYVTEMKKLYNIPESYKIVKPKSPQSISAELRERRELRIKNTRYRVNTKRSPTKLTRRKGGKGNNCRKMKRKNASRKKK